MTIPLRFLFLTLALALFVPTESQAKFIVISRGDTISDLGPISGGRGNNLPQGALYVGYKYSFVSVFWLDFWRYDGTYCVHDGNKRFDPLTKTQAAQLLGKSESDLDEPFWYHFPPGLVILGVIIAIAIPVSLIGKAKERGIQSLLQDPRYQHALDLFMQKSQPPKTEEAAEPAESHPLPTNPDLTSQAWDAAIDHLIAQGIERAVAEQNFQKVLQHLAQSQAGTA